jgi:hypothetical protein
MSMPAVISQSWVSRSSSSWNRFWFTPSDPTVLAAIRIVTGVIALYTLIGYSLDIQELLGEHAWIDLQLRMEQVNHSPTVNVPFGWVGKNYRPPQTAEERLYQSEYLRKWGEPAPLPYPRSAEEVLEYDAYRDRWGVDPRNVIGTGEPVWSIWFYVTDPFWMNVVQGGFVLCGFLFVIGCLSRLTSVLTWFAVLCYIHRDPVSLFGADTMLAVLLLYLMIGPSGAALSFDRWFAVWRAKRRGLPVPTVQSTVSANLAVRLIQIHACIIYGAAGLAKLQGQSWWYGIAPWGTLANFEFAPMQYGIYVDFLRFLAKTRWLYEVTMTVGALGTLAFEIGYPFLIWRPAFRTLWLWLAVVLHAGIGMLMGLRTFSVLMLVFNLAFVSPLTLRWVLGMMKSKDKDIGRQTDKETGSQIEKELASRSA